MGRRATFPHADPSLYNPLLEEAGGRPAYNSIFPKPKEYLRKTEPCPSWGVMSGLVSSLVVADADVGVKPHSFLGCQRIVCVDQAAFGPLQVVSGKSIRDSTEPKGVG
jgi:hypothetical protein